MMQEKSPQVSSGLHFEQNNDDGVSLSAPMIMDLIEAVHNKGASFRFQAKGHSMTPVIRDGDIITVSPLKDLMPRRGDVLAFRHPERPQMMVHRVLHAKERKCFIKGDNCSKADGWIPAENILGVITNVEKGEWARFWPNRSEPHFWSTVYLLIYPFWLPVRRIMAREWHRLRKIIYPGN